MIIITNQRFFEIIFVIKNRKHSSLILLTYSNNWLTFKSTFRKQINNFQIEFKKYNDTLNVAKNSFDLFHFNISNTSTSSIILIKKKYRSRFLLNVVRFLMLIFNTSIVTSIFFEQFIVDFFFYAKNFENIKSFIDFRFI